MFSREINQCEVDVPTQQGQLINIQDIRITAKVLIFLGYVYLIGALLIVFGGCAVYSLYKKWIAMDQETAKALKLDRSGARGSERRKAKIRKFELKHPTLIKTMQTISSPRQIMKKSSLRLSQMSRISYFNSS